MANKQTGGVTEMSKSMYAVEQPLSFQEKFTLELMKREITSGYFDDGGRYYKPSGAGSGVTAQPQTTPSAQPAAPAAAAPTAAPAATVTIITTPGYTVPPLNLTRVQPGDLITAGFFNALIDACMMLDDRLRDLETRPTLSTSGNAPAQPVTPPAPVEPATPKRVFEVKTASINASATQSTMTLTINGEGLEPRGLRSIVLGALRVDMDRIEGNDETITILLRGGDIGEIAAVGKAKVENFEGNEIRTIKGVVPSRLTVTVTNTDKDSEVAPVKIATGKNLILAELRRALGG